MPSLTRRMALKFVALGTSVAGVLSPRRSHAQASKDSAPPSFKSQWHNTHDRVWLGEDLWANPMENWRIVDGAAECQSFGGDRNIHLITHQLTNPKGEFQMTLHATRVKVKQKDGGFGFRVGIRSDLNEYRSNCFAKNGITCGVVDNQLVLGPQKTGLNMDEIPSSYRLVLTGEPAKDAYKLTLTVLDPETGTQHGVIVRNVPTQNVLGNIAVVNNLDAKIKGGRGSQYRFHEWTVGGDAFTVKPEQKFGPILWSMYSLSDSRSDEGFVMKISALTGPLGEKDNQTVELKAKLNDEWKSLGEAKLDTDAWTATFRIPNWNEKQSTPFKLIYREQHKDGSETVSERTGIIRENPAGRPLRLGALTCQNDYGFPYEPVANNLLALDPDMLYFSGDQLYENHGGYGIIRDPAEPAILNYLRKFYQHGWAFGEAMRDRPTLCLPDDHDVFQGNIWGEGGAKMTSGSTSSKGGYREPARMVNVVHKTNTAHHPDFYDPEPCKQDISVYYGVMIYGDVGFAVVADRQWKSGPERVETGSGRADHVSDPDFDTQKLDKPGLVLLGERQEEFLEEWARNWDGHALKVLLSQTVFAGVATHHGGYNGYLKADLDCGSWPQTPRNNAIRIFREAKPLHINGDQHLTTLVQYGVDEQRDSNWSFCTPAISAGYPRWWRPDEIGMPHENRPQHGLANTGEFIDGFGNKAYVYAVGNPEVGTKRNRYEKAHQKGSGFGLVTIDPKEKTYLIESFRFLVDATDGNADNQFPGWPVTIHQQENGGDNLLS
ncbi:alkaline phosphatase D family protein [Thalassoroseus pseudoceratinae]|uniref:alkaline phosphatase D family protein n=1 Tax=Thalassoroseus pseudoceratinae TaxID=2713176 RepID=UPI00141F4008|nr:alkaline phosphatase D family protein [Thalassoroseus pseudoceratinae]